MSAMAKWQSAGPAADRSRCPAAALTVFAGIAAAFILGTLSGTADAKNLYRTNRILEYGGHECIGQKPGTCVTVRSRWMTVEVGGSRLLELSCTPSFPYLVGWDSKQHEHMRLVAVSGRPDVADASAAAAINAAHPAKLGVVALNNWNVRGWVKLFIGCSTTKWHDTPFMTSREGIPGKHVGYTGDQP
ncbi:hypothetical protein [Geminicoccus flavidas]|uniref:hypothetical protein n=1 Tax=Geminicoccus flavidas TaxID=2506407 RepID=UPI00135A7CB9|nr:hypothetical protein [Geminicoccus flavidas]